MSHFVIKDTHFVILLAHLFNTKKLPHYVITLAQLWNTSKRLPHFLIKSYKKFVFSKFANQNILSKTENPRTTVKDRPKSKPSLLWTANDTDRYSMALDSMQLMIFAAFYGDIEISKWFILYFVLHWENNFLHFASIFHIWYCRKHFFK